MEKLTTIVENPITLNFIRNLQRKNFDKHENHLPKKR